MALKIFQATVERVMVGQTWYDVEPETFSVSVEAMFVEVEGVAEGQPFSHGVEHNRPWFSFRSKDERTIAGPLTSLTAVEGESGDEEMVG